MSWTDRFVSSTAAGGDGLLITTPWTLAEAIANAAAGMRFNVAAGTYANTTTSRTFNVAGTAIAPIMWEGYSVTPGDICGRAGIPANNALTKPVISFTTGQLVASGALQVFSGLDIQSACTTANGAVASTGASIRWHRCRFANTASNSAARAFTSTGTVVATSCYFSATTTADTCARFQSNFLAVGCSTRGGIIGSFGNGIGTWYGCAIDSPTTSGFNVGNGQPWIINCSVYNCTSGVTSTSATAFAQITNSTFSTCTNGVNQSAGTNSSAMSVRNCQFFNVTNPIVGVQECATAADDLYVQQGNVTLTADPFANAAAHDFTLTGAGARGAGIPGAFENETYSARTDAGAVGGFISPPGAGLKRFNPTYGAG